MASEVGQRSGFFFWRTSLKEKWCNYKKWSQNKGTVPWQGLQDLQSCAVPKSSGLAGSWRETGCCAWGTSHHHEYLSLRHVLSSQQSSFVPHVKLVPSFLQHVLPSHALCSVTLVYGEIQGNKTLYFSWILAEKIFSLFLASYLCRDAESQAVFVGEAGSPQRLTFLVSLLFWAPKHTENQWSPNTLCNHWPWSGSKLS